jgi:hypothetical protein
MKLFIKSSFYLILLILLANQASAYTIIVKESRKGEPIGEIRHEMQYMVATSLTNHQPFVTTTDSIRLKSVCEGEVVTFNFTTNDSDLSDSLSISWNNSLAGANWSNTNGKVKHPTATLTWSPSEGYGRSIPYNFAVTVKDDAFPVRASYTQVYQIIVNPKPKAKIVITDSCCYSYWLKATRISGSGPTYTWKCNDFVFHPNIGPVTFQKFTQFGVFHFTMTMVAGGCSNTYYDSIVNFPLKAKLPNDTAVCKDDIINLKLKLYPMPHNYYVQWSSGNHIIKRSDTSTSLNIRIIRDTTIIVYASISEACTCMGTSDTIHIKLLNCSSINDQVTQDHIKMSPNPASDKVSISTDFPGMKFKTLSIFNNLGIQVKQYNNIGANSVTVYRDFANSGLYFVNILMMNGDIIKAKLIWK